MSAALLQPLVLLAGLVLVFTRAAYVAADSTGFGQGLEARAAPLRNISGVYKGGWEAAPGRQARVVLKGRRGSVALRLYAVATPRAGILSVEGELVLHDGTFATDRDVALNIQGVFMGASGKLLAVADSTQPFDLPRRGGRAGDEEEEEEEEEEEGGEEQGLQPLDPGGDDSGHRRAVQRVAAELLLLMGGSESQPDELGEVPLATLAAVAARATATKECHFSLQLGFRSARGAAWPGAAPRAVSIPELAHGATAADALVRLVGALEGPCGAEAQEAHSPAAAREAGQQLHPREASLVLLWRVSTSLASPPLQSLRDLEFSGALTSANCGVALTLNGSATPVGSYLGKATNYTLMVTVLAFLQVLLLVRQMEASAAAAAAARVSLWTVGHQAVMDAYCCLLHLTVGIMASSLFNAFCTVAFFNFVLFAIMGLRWLLFAWRARRGGAPDAWVASRELSALYARFYSALLAAVVLSYYLQKYMKLALLPVYSFWLPQVLLSARSDQAQPLRPEYVLGMSATRLALPLYLFGCPHNLLRVPPSPGLCLALVAYVAAQAAVLVVQYCRGPRAFLPKSLLPPRYDYFRPVTLECKKGVAPAAAPSCCGGDVEGGGDAGLECVICMADVRLNNVDAYSPTQRMVTPCGHFFHAACLRLWEGSASGAFTCPTCRRVLPSL